MFKCDLIKGLVLMCKIWIRSFIKVLSCMTGCFGQPDEAACQFICQWELGQSNEKYLKLLTCMGENGCLTMQPDGVCLSSARYSIKVEKILKGSLDSIPSPSPSLKIQIMGRKVCLRCKGKTLLGIVNKLLKTKSFWHQTVMFALITSNKLSCQFF